ncbi:universal stress protein [Haliea sp. E1-2-M8]|uniref:universal stress protein n=1 Tax=Haliea sp. E1-2-M8 TaxID=3064706 RepID=UPI0027250C0E|nr:universal stress protein [Haliea sp. E1-2-M8]MDO8861323.1 universal stress protein [Haliea sp. E1-2-M8]
MFTSALVALDLSPAEEPILDCLPDLLEWGVSKVTLGHVIPVGYNQFAGYGHEDDYRAWLEKCAVPLRESGLDVAIVVRSAGAVADELLAVAADVEADLVVIGSRGQSRVRSLFIGSVARDVLRKTTRPVLMEWVEPSADKTREHCEAVCKKALAHVLLATDLSKHAARAESAFIELAGRAGQSDLLTVLTPDVLDGTPALPVMVAAALDDIRKRLPPQATQGKPLIEEGKPCDTIAHVAEERECTLIIIGKHGQGWLESTVIGSTAARLCETARRPVLMVPIKEQERI